MSARILVTGSRDWMDAETIRRALSEAWHRLGRPHDAVLVQGECHLGGADKIAADTWRGWGYPVEGHPAEMGPSGHVLGPERNARMVALGADLCLAFPLPSSRGTRNCMRLAREAGIPVHVYHPRDTPTDDAQGGIVIIDPPKPAPLLHPCLVGRHRWAWLTNGRQACGYCGRPR